MSSQASRHNTTGRLRRIRLGVAALLFVAMVAGLVPPPSAPAPVFASGPGCQSSINSSAGYTVEVCITEVADGAVLIGDQTVNASVTHVVGSSLGASKVIYSLDGQYL